MKTEKMTMAELEAKANLGDAEAQSALGVRYYFGGTYNKETISKDDKKALKWLRPAAEKRVADAQHCLGFVYFNGHGVSKDYAEAARQWLLAANQGHAEAQHCLGLNYDKGDGVRQNDREAAKWHHFAAEQGHVESQFNLGMKYRDGRGVPQSIRESYIWFSLASTNGDKDSVKNKKIAEEQLTPAALSRAQDEAVKRMKKIREIQAKQDKQC